MWSGTMRFCAEIYLVIGVTSFIGSNSIRVNSFYNPTEKFCSFIAIYGMIFAVGFPVFIVINYWRNLK